MRIKSAIGWKQGEAVPGRYKERLLISLGNGLGLKAFVESGTANASTLIAVHEHFDECHSIELSTPYFDEAVKKCRPFKNIHLYKGDSRVMMKVVIQIIKQPALFWCDAHVCGGLSADEGDPLPHELTSIMQHSPDSLILVDDEPNAELTRCNINWNGWVKEYHSGIIFIHKGQFKIEFE